MCFIVCRLNQVIIIMVMVNEISDWNHRQTNSLFSVKLPFLEIMANENYNAKESYISKAESGNYEVERCRNILAFLCFLFVSYVLWLSHINPFNKRAYFSLNSDYHKMILFNHFLQL